MNVDLDISQILHAPAKESLAALLAAQGEVVRVTKAKATEWQTDKRVADAVWIHLALKTFDYDLGNVPEEQRVPRNIKLRWRVFANGSQKLIRNSFGALEPLRYQNVFPNRFYLTAKEIKESIEAYMAKPKILANTGDLGGLLKVELVTKGDDDKKCYIALGETSTLRVPLEFPGPWMAKETTFELRVTYAGPNYPTTTPDLYLEKHFIPQLFDAGVNLTDEKFVKTMPTPIERSFGAGVTQMLSLTLDIEDSIKSIAICRKFQNSLVTTAGFHPYKAKVTELTDSVLSDLKALILANSDVVRAVGEIGLDYKHIGEGDQGEKDKVLERKWFIEQLRLAVELNLPVVVHERLAFADCYEILQSHYKRTENPEAIVVINCFTGVETELKQYLSLSSTLYFTFTGFIGSDDRGSHLRDLVKLIPVERLVLLFSSSKSSLKLFGSDAPHVIPFNMPRPFPRRNEPAFLPYVLFKVAECLSLDPFALAKITAKNAQRLFKLVAPLYNGQAPLLRPPNLEYFQKDEDEKSDAAKLAAAKKDKAARKELEIDADQEVYVLKISDAESVAFIVNPKEKAILEKQSAQKSPAELKELATSVLEIKVIEANTAVVKKGSAEVIYESLNQGKPKQGKRNGNAPRGRGGRGGDNNPAPGAGAGEGRGRGHGRGRGRGGRGVRGRGRGRGNQQ